MTGVVRIPETKNRSSDRQDLIKIINKYIDDRCKKKSKI